jgi:hypothetical protein
VLLGNFSCFGNGCGYVGTFSKANAYAVFAVTHNYQCAEAEATTALYYAGNAVDVHNAFIEQFFFWCNLRTSTTAITATVVAAVWATLVLCLRSL